MDPIKAQLSRAASQYYCGQVFATVAKEDVVHVHATGHTSGDGVNNAIYINDKKCDREDAALGHPQLLVMRSERTVPIPT